MVWIAANGPPHAMRGAQMRTPSGPPADEAHAACADLSGAQDQQEASRAQDLPLPSKRPGHHPPQSGVVHRYQLHPHAPGVPVSGGHYGLAQPRGAQLAAVEFHRHQLLRRGPEGGDGPIWHARDIQQRSGLAIHQHRIHLGAARRQGEDLHGWPRSLDHNRMIERLWRSLKYECVYLNAFETGSEARRGSALGSAITTKNARTHRTGC